MPPSTTDYSKEYAEAQKAYYQNDLPEAEAIAHRLLQDYPDDPHLLLLSGHICLGLQDFRRSEAFYNRVLEVTDQHDYHDYAHQGLAQVRAYSGQGENGTVSNGIYAGNQTVTQRDEDYPAIDNEFGDLRAALAMDLDDADDFPIVEDLEDWPVESDLNHSGPLAKEEEETFLVPHSTGDRLSAPQPNYAQASPFFGEDAEEFIEFNEDELVEFNSAVGPEEEDTLASLESPALAWDDVPLTAGVMAEPDAVPADLDDDISLGSLGADLFDEPEEAPPAQEGGFLEEFGILNDQDLEKFGDLQSDILTDNQAMPDTGLFEAPSDNLNPEEFNFDDFPEALGISADDSLFALGDDGPSGNLGLEFTTATETKSSEAIATPSIKYLAWFEKAPLQKKQLWTASGAAAASAIATLIVTVGVFQTTPAEQRNQVIWPVAKTGLLTTLLAGAASFGTTFLFGQMAMRQLKRSTDDLQAQFDAVSQGNLNVKATVFAEDEFGSLATGFNRMARVILNTTSEAQRRAEETEQSKEDLQRQVIRLLDDVEGSARGDFTVQAEVTADVLGAVADAFNLTIQNLREIVQQVKQAARQVNKNAADSESFARGLSSDALRQAEELAVTLNSVQMMTDSIQRVAENAREAEEVARTASSTALKGGESVEHTVAGILQIRETVAETARKVKRLAESSQEISKIVAVVSQIASRTNLLAFNASIEAARAGESGKGFAIVADEVRQLADRSAKALKEIEQIVLQIQSETSLVMTAMEEGTQQVIDGTKRAEQAKQSLDDIIQVSNRIDALVRSITADTVEQRENSRAVAQVMQSVELTAQETSRESQRVAGSLQKLVVIARDLLASVERFRVEATDEA